MSTPWPASSIERLLAFLPALERGPFHRDAGGYRVPNEQLTAFYQALYDTGIVFPFDWSSWARGEGEALVAGRCIETASPDEVRRAITAHIRADRFSEGHFLQVVENGEMAALIRRLGQLRVSPTWSYRIGTWNVERAPRSRCDRQRQEVAGADADVWVLTETRDALDLRPAYHAVSSRAHGHGERWVTVWSRLPLLDEIAVRDPVRTAAALYDGPAGPILVYGTVLPWHADRGPDGATASSPSRRGSGPSSPPGTRRPRCAWPGTTTWSSAACHAPTARPAGACCWRPASPRRACAARRGPWTGLRGPPSITSPSRGLAGRAWWGRGRAPWQASGSRTTARWWSR